MRKAILNLGLTLVVAAVLAAGAYVTWLRTPPPMPDTFEQAVALFASPRYLRLPEARRETYIAHTRRLVESMPESQRRAQWKRLHDHPILGDAADRAMQDLMVAQARALAAADAPTRLAMLDAWLARGEPRSEIGDLPSLELRRAQTRLRMRQYVQHGDPQNQAYLQEFWKALRDRRRELGMSP